MPDDAAELIRPSATCPRCGARPAMRVTEAMVAALALRAGNERVGTYQCQRRGCGAIYDLTADGLRPAAERTLRPSEPIVSQDDGQTAAHLYPDGMTATVSSGFAVRREVR